MKKVYLTKSFRHLHKIYLEQCEYFRCLFSGSWSDSENNCYNLAISDERITFEGLNSVFASLYQNEIKFELKDLGGILATATLFNLVRLDYYLLILLFSKSVSNAARNLFFSPLAAKP